MRALKLLDLVANTNQEEGRLSGRVPSNEFRMVTSRWSVSIWRNNHEIENLDFNQS